MAPEDVGARTSMHPTAGCQEGHSLSNFQVHRAEYQLLGPHPLNGCQGLSMHGPLWSQECLLPSVLIHQLAQRQ